MVETRHPPGALQTQSIADELATRAGPLEVIVVSPARPVFEDRARFITVAGLEGQMGVWPRHADLVAALGVGRLRVGLTGGGEARFAVWGGFLKVGGNRVTVLVDRAMPAEEVDAAAVKEELDETLAALRHPKSDEEFRQLLDQRRWCQTQLKLVG